MEKKVRAKNKYRCHCEFMAYVISAEMSEQMSVQECEGITDLMRKMVQWKLIFTYLHVQINCTAPLETSGAIVRYRIKC